MPTTDDAISFIAYLEGRLDHGEAMFRELVAQDDLTRQSLTDLAQIRQYVLFAKTNVFKSRAQAKNKKPRRPAEIGVIEFCGNSAQRGIPTGYMMEHLRGPDLPEGWRWVSDEELKARGLA